MQTIYFSKSQNAFFNSAVHGVNIPGDSVEISEAEHKALMLAQSAGKTITADASGKPVATVPVATIEEQVAMAERLRAKAYRDEADPLFFKAQRGEATMEQWQAKVAEIKTRYPGPAAQ